ncbi:carbohydrate ABC transporter permease [Catenibacillus scindens]|uniref:carbohydrate ABC transporter permease n=1 Tax=Catenibacillus scindens TaxID=673271 RepID=UPI00320B5171
MTKKLSRVSGHVILILLSFLALFPIYWMIISSLKSSPEIFGYSMITTQPSFSNYIDAFTTVPLFRMMLNSVVVSLGTAVIQLVVAVLFAYAFTRWNFKGKIVVYGILSITWLIPVQAIMIPNYVEIINMGLNNTLFAMILPHCCSVFANISMYQNFNSIPKALIDAARMDGSSELQILKDIVLPNMKSSIASLGIVLVITAWNDYLWPTLVARTDEVKPIQIGLKSFSGTDTNMWGASMAAATISTIPILIVYIFMSRKIISSFMKGGIK